MKECRRCKANKALSEYYIHAQMADGHLNICKDCTKNRVRKFSRSERGREYDKKRNQTRKRKEWLRKYLKKRRASSPIKTRCRNKFSKAIIAGKLIKKPCEVCGDLEVQGHHKDYNKPLEVIWLCGIHHREIHDQFQRKH